MREYDIKNIKTQEIMTITGKNFASATKANGLKAREWKVVYSHQVG